MKKIFCLLVLIFAALFITSCADPNGLHNQESTTLTFVFTNFTAAEDGDYSIPGGFLSGYGWTDNSNVDITLKDGEGTSTEIITINSDVKFTLVPANNDAWPRAWYPAIKGNAVDESQGNKYHNFWVGGIPMGTNATILVDGSTMPVTITVK